MLKEFYIGQEEDGEGYHSPDGQLPDYGMAPSQYAYTAQAPYQPVEPNPQNPQQYLRGGSQPRLQPRNEGERQRGVEPTGAFVGARVGRDTDGSDESIAHLANVLGHEYTHGAIEGEMEDWANEKFGSAQPVAPTYGTNALNTNPFAKRPVLNQPEIDADTQRLDARTQAKNYAHEYGAHQSDQPNQYAVNSQLVGRSDTSDMYNQYLQSLQPQAMNMLPPTQ